MISGPSGSGKGTICAELQKVRDFYLSISMTSRAPRGKEQNGVEYWFVSREEFEAAIKRGDLLEFAETYGNYYGTPKTKMVEQMNAGRDVVLEIDMKGAAQVRKVFPEAIGIFILPPSLKVLRERIMNRGTDSPEAIKTRLSQAVSEIRRLPEYNYYVVNDDLTEAVQATCRIMDGKTAPNRGDMKQIISRYEQEEQTL